MGVRGRRRSLRVEDDNLQRMNIFSAPHRGLKNPCFLALAIWATMATTVFAHPGHSMSEASASHLLTSPDHAAVLALFGIAAAVASHLIGQQAARRVLRGCALAAFAGAVVLWHVRV